MFLVVFFLSKSKKVQDGNGPSNVVYDGVFRDRRQKVLKFSLGVMSLPGIRNKDIRRTAHADCFGDCHS